MVGIATLESSLRKLMELHRGLGFVNLAAPFNSGQGCQVSPTMTAPRKRALRLEAGRYGRQDARLYRAARRLREFTFGQ